MEITIEVGEVLFEFSSFENWVAKASSRYGQQEIEVQALLGDDSYWE